MITGNCTDLGNTLQTKPISVAISGYNLQFYSKGTFTGCSSNPILDHAVLLVGFNTTKGWKIKNSWGSGWGELGYGWITAGTNNCGICKLASVITI